MATKKVIPKGQYTPNTTEDIIKQISKVSKVFDDKDELAELFLVEIKKSLD